MKPEKPIGLGTRALPNLKKKIGTMMKSLLLRLLKTSHQPEKTIPSTDLTGTPRQNWALLKTPKGAEPKRRNHLMEQRIIFETKSIAIEIVPHRPNLFNRCKGYHWKDAWGRNSVLFFVNENQGRWHEDRRYDEQSHSSSSWQTSLINVQSQPENN